MSRSYRKPFLKEKNHYGSNKPEKKLANAKVRRYGNISVNDAQNLYETQDDDYWEEYLEDEYVVDKTPKRVKHIEDEVNDVSEFKGKNYKKAYEQWDISDYRFYVGTDDDKEIFGDQTRK